MNKESLDGKKNPSLALLVPPGNEKRYIEIDMIRGVAILLVVFYHLIFDLSYFQVIQINLHSGFWLYFQRLAATLFVLIFGICIAISAQKPSVVKRFSTRALKLGAVAALITIATWFYIPTEVILFGVIHFFTIATLLSLLFVSLRKWNLPIGIAFILIGLHVNAMNTTNPLLVLFGIPTVGMHALDYFPLLPWFGVVLIGIAIGNYVYVVRKIKFQVEGTKLLALLVILEKIHLQFTYFIN